MTTEFDLFFASNDKDSPYKHKLAPTSKNDTWKIMIVDDDEGFHSVCSLTLSGLVFEGKGITLLHAKSEIETISLLKEHSDTALILLDIVMEKENSGLTLVKEIREELNNKLVRINIHTGQPTFHPPQEIVEKFDINDYETKVDMTAQKLFTTIISSLRCYRELLAIEKDRLLIEELQKIARQNHKLNTDTLKSMSSSLESRQNIIQTHVNRISELTNKETLSPRLKKIQASTDNLKKIIQESLAPIEADSK
jgi:CheY-like chemotaxis protein